MTSRQNITFYDKTDIVAAIKKFERLDDQANFTAAVTKLIKIGLRTEGLLKESK